MAFKVGDRVFQTSEKLNGTIVAVKEVDSDTGIGAYVMQFDNITDGKIGWSSRDFTPDGSLAFGYWHVSDFSIESLEEKKKRTIVIYEEE